MKESKFINLGEWVERNPSHPGQCKYQLEIIGVKLHILKECILGVFKLLILLARSFNLSSTRYVQLDCSIFRVKDLKVQLYKNQMGEGKLMGEVTPKGKEAEWRYPKRNSSYEVLYNKICEEHQ